MASHDKPVVFISSSMSELQAERAAVRKVVKRFGDGAFETFCFEDDAVASLDSPQEQWRRQLERTQILVALLYQKLGQYTMEEIRVAREMDVPVLLFRKRDNEGHLERTDPDFFEWLEDPETGVTAKYFDTTKELKKSLQHALAQQIMQTVKSAQGVRRAASRSTEGMMVNESPHGAPKRVADDSSAGIVSDLAEHLGISLDAADSILRRAEQAVTEERSDHQVGGIFISYSRRDQEYVDELVAHLDQSGLACWIDKSGIDYGDRWEKEIQTNLDACAVFVVVMTESSENRPWVMREIARAERQQKPILPLLLDGDEFFRLSDLQYESVVGGKMPPKRWIEQVQRLARGE